MPHLLILANKYLFWLFQSFVRLPLVAAASIVRVGGFDADVVVVVVVVILRVFTIKQVTVKPCTKTSQSTNKKINLFCLDHLKKCVARYTDMVKVTSFVHVMISHSMSQKLQKQCLPIKKAR